MSQLNEVITTFMLAGLFHFMSDQSVYFNRVFFLHRYYCLDLGWLHHLGRHAVACFLTRGDLWVSWTDGRDVFDRYLLDADWAVSCLPNVSNLKHFLTVCTD